MSCSWRLFLFAQILLLAGCQPSAPPRAIESLALLPLDNLSGDRALDWLGRGAQLALHRQLAASRTVAAAAYPEVSSATLGRATRLLHTTVDKHAGQLRLEAVIEDALTHRQVGDRIILQVPPEQIPGGLNQLARRLANDAAVGPSQNPEALAAFVEAESASERQAKIAALTRAAGLDPQFALPLITLAELQLAAGKRDEAQSALNALAARQLDPIERAQAGLLQANLAQANLAQASPQRAQALEKLAAAAPLQANLQLFAATQLQSLHQMAPVVEAYNRVLRLDPGNAEIWNRLGYANAYLGRLPAARAALETFQKLEPDNANALDSLGEVHYLSGEFKQAAGYFQAAYSKSPQFSAGRAMLKAAYALLLDGKMAAADQAAAQYAKSAGQFPAAEVAHAHWLYSRGQPTEALAYLAAAAAKSATAAHHSADSAHIDTKAGCGEGAVSARRAGCEYRVAELDGIDVRRHDLHHLGVRTELENDRDLVR